MKIVWFDIPTKKPDGSYGSPSVKRAKVPGGWFVYAVEGDASSGLTFFPDPNHEWDGNSLP